MTGSQRARVEAALACGAHGAIACRGRSGGDGGAAGTLGGHSGQPCALFPNKIRNLGVQAAQIALLTFEGAMHLRTLGAGLRPQNRLLRLARLEHAFRARDLADCFFNRRHRRRVRTRDLPHEVERGKELREVAHAEHHIDEANTLGAVDAHGALRQCLLSGGQRGLGPLEIGSRRRYALPRLVERGGDFLVLLGSKLELGGKIVEAALSRPRLGALRFDAGC